MKNICIGHYKALLFFVYLILFCNVVTTANNTAQISIDSVNNNDNLTRQICNVSQKDDSSQQNKQHDYLFYFINIIITSSCTMFINWIKSKYDMKKQDNEPNIDRLKTIAIEGIKVEKRIYNDLKTAQEHLSYGRNKDALEQATYVSNYLEDNKLDVREILYTDAISIISYITEVSQRRKTRNEQHESQLFTTYYKHYRT